MTTAAPGDPPLPTMDYSLHELVVNHAPAAINDLSTHLAKPSHMVIAVLVSNHKQLRP